MTQENVVVVRFMEPSKAYQALSVLKECDAKGRIGLESAAVVERRPEGELTIPESADNLGPVGTASGSLIGMLVGVLGGPVGVLLGWGAGAMMGGAFDVGGEVQPAGRHVAPHHLLQAGLVDRDAAVFQHPDLGRVHVQAEDVVAHFGQACAADQAHVTGADDCDFHGDCFLWV